MLGLEIRNWKLEIRKTGDRKKGWTSNIERSTSNIECGYRSAHFFNKIETPKAYHNSMLEVPFGFFKFAP